MFERFLIVLYSATSAKLVFLVANPTWSILLFVFRSWGGGEVEPTPLRIAYKLFPAIIGVLGAYSEGFGTTRHRLEEPRCPTPNPRTFCLCPTPQRLT